MSFKIENNMVVEEGVLTRYLGGEVDTLVIPEGVRLIEEEVFWGLNAKRVIFPNSLERIKQNAFTFSSVKRVTIPRGTVIEDWAFSCSDLEFVELNGVKLIGEGVFEKCTNLTRVVVVDTNVPDKTFYGCHKLKSAYLSGCVRELGKRAFYGSGLEQIVVPNHTIIASAVFANCRSLQYAELPDSLCCLPHYIFQHCTALKSVDVKEVNFVGRSAFEGCISLEKLEIPHVEQIGAEAFYSCSNLQHLELGPLVDDLSAGVLVGCKSLTLHVVPGSYAEDFGHQIGLNVVNYPISSAIEDNEIEWFFPDGMK